MYCFSFHKKNSFEGCLFVLVLLTFILSARPLYSNAAEIEPDFGVEAVSDSSDSYGEFDGETDEELSESEDYIIGSNEPDENEKPDLQEPDFGVEEVSDSSDSYGEFEGETDEELLESEDYIIGSNGSGESDPTSSEVGDNIIGYNDSDQPELAVGGEGLPADGSNAISYNDPNQTDSNAPGFKDFEIDDGSSDINEEELVPHGSKIVFVDDEDDDLSNEIDFINKVADEDNYNAINDANNANHSDSQEVAIAIVKRKIVGEQFDELNDALQGAGNAYLAAQAGAEGASGSMQPNKKRMTEEKSDDVVYNYKYHINYSKNSYSFVLGWEKPCGTSKTPYSVNGQTVYIHKWQVDKLEAAKGQLGLTLTRQNKALHHESWCSYRPQ